MGDVCRGRGGLYDGGVGVGAAIMKVFQVTWTVTADTLVHADDEADARDAVIDYFEARQLHGDGRQIRTVEDMTITAVSEAQSS